MKKLESAFVDCASKLPDLINSSEAVKWHTYAAVNCGGGEVALYTMIAGMFRNCLESIDSELRLAINQEISKSVKPDFQVFKHSTPKEPLFAAEFKLLYETGISNSRPESVLIRIHNDLDRLSKIACSSTSVAMIVFHYSETSPAKDEILTALAGKGFSTKASIQLWQPAGVTGSGYLHIHVCDNDSIHSHGNPVEDQVVAG